MLTLLGQKALTKPICNFRSNLDCETAMFVSSKDKIPQVFKTKILNINITIFYILGSANTWGFVNPEKSRLRICYRNAEDVVTLPETGVKKISVGCKIITNDSTSKVILQTQENEIIKIFNNYNLSGINIDGINIEIHMLPHDYKFGIIINNDIIKQVAHNINNYSKRSLEVGSFGPHTIITKQVYASKQSIY